MLLALQGFTRLFDSGSEKEGNHGLSIHDFAEFDHPDGGRQPKWVKLDELVGLELGLSGL
jgi:hypothetical protein